MNDRGLTYAQEVLESESFREWAKNAEVLAKMLRVPLMEMYFCLEVQRQEGLINVQFGTWLDRLFYQLDSLKDSIFKIEKLFNRGEVSNEQ